MKVKAVYTYPIKSIRGISRPCLQAGYTGFVHDRCFMLFNVAKQKNMHVSEYPEMCLFTTAFVDPDSPVPEKLTVTYTKDHVFDQPERKVRNEPLTIDLQPKKTGLTTFEINMHSSPCTGYDMGPKFNDWFSERFGYEVKLIHIMDNKRKVLGNMTPSVAVKQRATLGTAQANGSTADSWLTKMTSTASALIGYATGEDETEGEDEGISFADVAPYLIISTKSWENVQDRLPYGEIMDISKFRPNVIVEGAEEAFEEDFWADLQIAGPGVKMVLTQNCGRCNSLNVDYDTGKVGAGEAGKVLKKLQSDRRVDPGTKWSPVFGRYGFLGKIRDGKSTVNIKVGDDVEVMKRNAARTKMGKFISPSTLVVIVLTF